MSRHAWCITTGRKVEGPIYKFPTVEGGELRARELMGESAYFRVVPISLLDIFLMEDSDRVRDLETLVDILGPTKYQEIVEPVCAQIKARSELYVERKKKLYQHESPHFRPSVDKKKRELEFTAINCHIQRLIVFGGADVQQPVATYDTITHGAPAAHSLGFKQGGLWRLLQHDKSGGAESERAQRENSKRHRSQIAQILDHVRSAVRTLNDRFPDVGHQQTGGLQKRQGKEPADCSDVADVHTGAGTGADVDTTAATMGQTLTETNKNTVSVPGGTDGGTTPAPPASMVQEEQENGTAAAAGGERGADSNSVETMANNGAGTEPNKDPRSETLPGAAIEKPRRQQSKDDYFGTGDFEVLESVVRELRLLAELLDAKVIAEAVAEATRLRMTGPMTWASVKTNSSDDDDDADETDRTGSGGGGGPAGNLTASNPFASAAARQSRKRRGGGSLEPGQTQGFVQLKAELYLAIDAFEETQSGRARTVLTALGSVVDLAQQTVVEADRLMILSELLTRGEAGGDCALVLRRDIAFSQACTILVTSFVSLLMTHGRDLVFLQQLAKVGLLVQFESLLSTQGNEMGMIEDMAQAVQDLEGVVFKLECAAIDKDALEKVVVTGKRYRMCITIHVHTALFNRLPDVLRDGATICVNPVFFTHGVNEMQTIGACAISAAPV